jgi:ppGpp synthetase/RelA/SpoT-type nucleotidyltranferase
MIVPAQLTRRYNEYKPLVVRFSDSIKQTLRKYCDEYNYAFICRIKSLESLSEKIESGRYSSWSEIDDIFACSIIIPNLKHEESVLDFIKSIYPADKIILRKSKMKSPDVFRFDTTRYISHLEISNIIYLAFEIQVRTVLEHAWITTTHDIVYKYKKIDWRRLRLASELKANLELLDNIILSFEENVYMRTENFWPETNSKIKIQKFIDESFENGLIPNEFLPNDGIRMVENLFGLLKEKHPYENKNLDKLTDNFINVIKLRLEHTKPDLFPRSISLYQFFLGILLEDSYLIIENVKLKPFISDELSVLFPITKSLKLQFDLNN